MEVFSKEYIILQLLFEVDKSNNEWLYGAEMVDISNGKLKLGTIYTTLQRMEKKGFIYSRLESKPKDRPGLPRRLYKKTSSGEKFFEGEFIKQLSSKAVKQKIYKS